MIPQMRAEPTLDETKSLVFEVVDRPGRRGRPVTFLLGREKLTPNFVIGLILANKLFIAPARRIESTVRINGCAGLTSLSRPWLFAQSASLSLRRFLKVCHLVEGGASIPKACEAESVSYRNFRFRVSNSSRLQERLKEAETTRFNLRHEQALESIMEAGHRSWLAHAWWCERCLPHLYSLRNVTRDSEDGQPAVGELPSEILAKHRQFYAEMLLEDQAKSDCVEQINQTSGEQIGQL
jgi:hypothetical protein